MLAASIGVVDGPAMFEMRTSGPNVDCALADDDIASITKARNACKVRMLIIVIRIRAITGSFPSSGRCPRHR